MKKKLFCKFLTMLGLLLILSVLVPLFPNNTVTALADTGKDKSKSYTLNIYNIILAKDTTYQLRTYNVGEDTKINFKSGDEEIASVNDDGVISAKKVGSTVITVTFKNGSNSTSLTCDVLVGPAAISVKWTQSLVILSIDNVDTYVDPPNVILKPSNTVESAKIKSLNTSVLYVTPGGRISGKAYGFAELRAYINDIGSDGYQKYDSCGVIVTSSDNVSKLEDFFNEHTELNQISVTDLLNALDKFFNKEFDQTSSSNLISSLNRYLNNAFVFK